MTPLFTLYDIVLIAITTAIIVGVSAYAMYGRTFSDKYDDVFDINTRKTGYTYGIPVYWMCCYVIAMLLVIPLLVLEGMPFFYLMGMLYFDSILVMAVYMFLLNLAMPALKRRLRATACVILWLLPNVLYFYMTMFHFPRNAPVLVLKIPYAVLIGVTLVWLAGFLVVMTKGIAGHHRFKKALFLNAYDAPEHVCALYQTVRVEMNIRGEGDDPNGMAPQYKSPLVSPATKTPLAIGLFKSRVVLPEKEYTEDELRLIFRHELIHIVRHDSMTKLFLLTCRALCWFWPFAWKAADDAAEEMELSCDEVALRDQDTEVKKEYGRLILTTASDAAGFTTCLSASAESISHRLQRIFEDKKRSMGLPVIVLAFLILMAVTRSVTFAVDAGTVADELDRQFIRLDGYKLAAVYDYEGKDIKSEKTAGEWTQDMLSLRICRLGGRYRYDYDGDTYTLEYRKDTEEDHPLMFTVTEHTFSIGNAKPPRDMDTVYYLD